MSKDQFCFFALTFVITKKFCNSVSIQLFPNGFHVTAKKLFSIGGVMLTDMLQFVHELWSLCCYSSPKKTWITARTQVCLACFVCLV